MLRAYRTQVERHRTRVIAICIMPKFAKPFYVLLVGCAMSVSYARGNYCNRILEKDTYARVYIEKLYTFLIEIRTNQKFLINQKKFRIILIALNRFDSKFFIIVSLRNYVLVERETTFSHWKTQYIHILDVTLNTCIIL